MSNKVQGNSIIFLGYPEREAAGLGLPAPKSKESPLHGASGFFYCRRYNTIMSSRSAFTWTVPNRISRRLGMETITHRL
jgi:hypothetical protein